MQRQKTKKKIENYLKKSKQKSTSSLRSEFKSYQPDSPLTQHYLTTGAILPEKKDQTGLLTSWIVFLFTRFFDISDNLTVGP